MNPTRSAKSTEISRRSVPAVGGAAGTAALVTGLAAASCEPHSPQNFTVGGFGEPQVGQARASAEPHSPQNLRPASFSDPHDEQTKRISPNVGIDEGYALRWEGSAR